MASLIELANSEAVENLATPSNIRLGRELADGGAVQVFVASADRIQARVGGGQSATQSRLVGLWIGERGLSWSCTCTNDRQLFCKHAVAVALTTGSYDHNQEDPR